MARRFNNDDTRYLNLGSAIVNPNSGGYPFSMACWFVSEAGQSGQDTLISLGDSAATAHIWALAVNTVGGDYIRANQKGSANSSAQSTTTFTDDTWHHAACAFVGNTERHVWLDGGGHHESVLSCSTNTPDETYIAKQVGLAANNPMDGNIAEVAIWAGYELTTADTLVLAAGYSPLFVKPENLVSCVRIFGNIVNEPDYLGSAWTGNGASVKVPHPPRIIYPAPPFIPSIEGALLAVGPFPTHFRL